MKVMMPSIVFAYFGRSAVSITKSPHGLSLSASCSSSLWRPDMGLFGKSKAELEAVAAMKAREAEAERERKEAEAAEAKRKMAEEGARPAPRRACDGRDTHRRTADCKFAF